MPILPSHEPFTAPLIQSPSVKHESSPYSSTSSTPSASPSPCGSPAPIDTFLPHDEHKSIDHSTVAIASLHPALFPSSSSSMSSPSLSSASRASFPSAASISPVLSSYAAYPPPLHPSMVNVTVISPQLQPQLSSQQPLSHSQLAIPLNPSAVDVLTPSAVSSFDARVHYNLLAASTAPILAPLATASSSFSFADMPYGVVSSESASFSSSTTSTTSSSPSSTGTSSPASLSSTTSSPHGHHFSPHFSMFTCVLNPALSVTCFRRGGPDGTRLGPLFVVREFDAKVIRSSPKLARPHSTTASGEPSATSEQAFRASIRQAMLNMNLRPENASKSEIRVLKAQGILGKRAPSASLLTAEDMCRLLIVFHKEECAKELRDATINWKEVEAQWLAKQQRTGEAGGMVDTLTDFTSKTIPLGNAFTHVPLKAEPGDADGDAGRPVVPHIIKVGEGIDEESMAVERGPTRTKAELKELREREKTQRKEEKEAQRELKRLEREVKKHEREQEKEEKKKRKRKADASPMLSATPAAGLEALLSAVEDASGGVKVRGPSSMPNIIRALSTPPSVDGRSSLVAAGLSFRLPSAAMRSIHPASSQSSPLYAPMPRRPQTPVGFTSTLTSTSPSPTSISPTSSTFSTSAFSSPITHPRPLVPHVLDRQHSGSTSPTGSDADERLVMVRVLSTESERAERERTRMKLDGFGLAQMDEGKAELGLDDDKRVSRDDVADKEMATAV